MNLRKQIFIAKKHIIEKIKMTTKQIEKKFPAYMENIKLPDCAKEQEFVVYRACRTRKIEKASFLNSYEENGFKVFDYPGLAKDDPQHFCMSVYAKIKDLKRFCSINQTKYQPPYLLAKGVTVGSCGVSCLTKDWKKTKNSHVDWWLYEGAAPWKYFEEVNYETECNVQNQ